MPISVTTTTFPTTTTTRTTTKHMLAHHHTKQSHYRPYHILNVNVSVEFSQQHASCVDMTILASQHKSSFSKLPTYNINTSDHHTHNALQCSTPSYNYYCKIDQHQHKRSTYTHLSNKSHKQKTTNTILENKKYTPKNEIEQIAQGL